MKMISDFFEFFRKWIDFIIHTRIDRSTPVIRSVGNIRLLNLVKLSILSITVIPTDKPVYSVIP